MEYLYYRSLDFNPYRNQAIENLLLGDAEMGAQILYLWQNDKTVFLGRNQNAYTECKVDQIRADNGFIARRISGGGAVYHDKANLNFSFFSPYRDYSVKRNFSIILDALSMLGLTNVQVSGRNDILLNGRKVSGNAFYKGRASCLHHGTLLIETDIDKMSAYLNVPKIKLDAKGVSSVASRVINIHDVDPSIDVDKICKAFRAAFTKYYGKDHEVLNIGHFTIGDLNRETKVFEDKRWRMGDDLYFDAQAVMRLDWGTVDIRMRLNGNVIQKARIYSDCLDPFLVKQKEELLVGADIYKGKEGVDDILCALREQKNEF